MENEIKYLREINEVNYRLGLAIGCLEIVASGNVRMFDSKTPLL